MDDEAKLSHAIDSPDGTLEEAAPRTEEATGIAVAEAAAPVGTDGLDEDEDTQPAQPPDLLHEMTAAMHATAARERERIEAAIEDRSNARVEQLRQRAAVESEELRRMATDDVDRIDGWAAAEFERIRLEAKRRSDERRAALEADLQEHDASVEADIGRVGKAVAVYRERLDAFFREVDGTTDPTSIARLAGSLPDMPDLDDLPEEVPVAPSIEAVSTAEAAPTNDVVAEDGAARAEAEAAEEARAELAADNDDQVIRADVDPVPEGEEAEPPLVGVMVPATPAPPAPVAPVSAIVSAPPTSSANSVLQHHDEAQHHRGALGILRTIAPWSRHDERDTTGASADTKPEDNGH